MEKFSVSGLLLDGKKLIPGHKLLGELYELRSHMTRGHQHVTILEQLSPSPALYPKVKDKTHLPNFPRE